MTKHQVFKSREPSRRPWLCILNTGQHGAFESWADAMIFWIRWDRNHGGAR